MIIKLFACIPGLLALAVLTACGNGSSGSSSTVPSPTPPATAYTFSKLAGPVIWTDLRRTIAVDGADRVYVTNGSVIYRVDANGPSIYLNSDTIAAAIGGMATGSLIEIKSINVGPDDKIYFPEGRFRKILVSPASGSASVHRDVNAIPGFPWMIGVVHSDNILLINLYDGLYRVASTGNSLLYDQNLVLGGTNCGSEDFAVSDDGFFAYLPGCNGSPMVGGNSDDSGVVILATTAIDVGLVSFWNFSAIGRHPSGGIPGQYRRTVHSAHHDNRAA